MLKITLPEFEIGDGAPLLLISGPCQIESRDHALFHAEALHKAARSAGMNFVYKSSFDKGFGQRPVLGLPLPNTWSYIVRHSA